MVKKLLIVLAFAMLLLCGCGAEGNFETMTDIFSQPAVAPRQVDLALPQEAAAQTVQSDTDGELYLCDGYVLTVQTFSSGDLDATFRELTGRSREQLTVMQTQSADVKCYETVWSAAGEIGDQLGRLKLLDDGNYHYTVTVMADAASAGQLTDTWQAVLNSFDLRTAAVSQDTTADTASQPTQGTGS